MLIPSSKWSQAHIYINSCNKMENFKFHICFLCSKCYLPFLSFQFLLQFFCLCFFRFLFTTISFIFISFVDFNEFAKEKPWRKNRKKSAPYIIAVFFSLAIIHHYILRLFSRYKMNFYLVSILFYFIFLFNANISNGCFCCCYCDKMRNKYENIKVYSYELAKKKRQ